MTPETDPPPTAPRPPRRFYETAAALSFSCPFAALVLTALLRTFVPPETLPPVLLATNALLTAGALGFGVVGLRGALSTGRQRPLIQAGLGFLLGIGMLGAFAAVAGAAGDPG